MLLLAGCARDYVMTLSSGERIRAATKPKLVNGFYYYKDASGNEGRPVFSGSVTEIAPASMSSGNQTDAFKNVQSK
jgi:hypothetical protein